MPGIGWRRFSPATRMATGAELLSRLPRMGGTSWRSLSRPSCSSSRSKSTKRMKLSANHLKRYKEIARLFWKYGRSDLVTQMATDGGIDTADLKPSTNGEVTPDQQ